MRALLCIPLFSLFLFACGGAKTLTSISSQYEPLATGEVETLVSQANRGRPASPDDPNAAFQRNAVLESYRGFDEEQQSPFLRMAMKENQGGELVRTAIFEVQLDEAMDFPTHLENVKVVFLKNQLIIDDLAGKKVYYFHVNTTGKDEVIANLPVTNAIGIGLAKGRGLAAEDLHKRSI
ncbi:hypothetical protein QWY85_02540 [Neolewinella lacunae]|uniref:Lipoprotein n=1 Tax=Neolewinella lacunae TaxID=1517758 RepID=A0A923T7A2_9BACT|nr:hypothetical protein [Neolewinella lacunae]MBC6992638.1 hypothetical protein [Neolewinella lacunae]MDN3633518.1 hypothetical protein [Neolewinella lacunae]